MAVHQLVAVGREEQLFNIQNKRAIVYKTSDFIHNGSRWYCTVPRAGDTINVKSIVFDTDLEIQELWNRIEYFKLEIGGQQIVKLDKPFLEIITTTERIDNKWNFMIDFSPFISNIPLVALGFHEVKYDVRLTNSIGINNIECLTENTYMDGGPRLDLVHNQQTLPIQQLQGDIIEFEERREVCINLQFNNICKGYFIYGDINNIQNVTLKYNHQTRYSYDRMMLRIISKKINDTLLYIPYNHSVDWKNTSFESYVDGFNHSGINSVKMKVEFLTPQTKIGLYGINPNILLIRHGIGGLRLYSNGSIHLLENFQHVVAHVPSPIATPIAQHTWEIATKRIVDGKDFCPIAYEKIKEGDEYCECADCHNCFSAVQLKNMFQTMANKCPLCRKSWINWVVYTNIRE